MSVQEESITFASRCDECEGVLSPSPTRLCQEHREARRKQKARQRARRYRRRKQGLAEDGLALTGEEVAALKALTSELLARENDLRWWSRRREAESVPAAVRDYFQAGVRVSKALTGLTEEPPQSTQSINRNRP